MDRRWFFACMAALPFGVRLTHEQGERIRVVGYLSSSAEPGGRHQAFREDLQKLGWVEGKNLRIEFRFGAGDTRRLAALADEIVKLKPDVIVCQSTPAVAAARSATRNMPIVMGF